MDDANTFDRRQAESNKRTVTLPDHSKVGHRLVNVRWLYIDTHPLGLSDVFDNLVRIYHLEGQ